MACERIAKVVSVKRRQRSRRYRDRSQTTPTTRGITRRPLCSTRQDGGRQLRRPEISFSQGAEWKAIIQHADRGQFRQTAGACEDERAYPAEPPPRTPVVSSAMMRRSARPARHRSRLRRGRPTCPIRRERHSLPWGAVIRPQAVQAGPESHYSVFVIVVGHRFFPWAGRPLIPSVELDVSWRGQRLSRVREATFRLNRKTPTWCAMVHELHRLLPTLVFEEDDVQSHRPV